MKDMTYLFLVIAIGLISAVTKGSWDELLLLNTIILGFTFILESNLLIKKEQSKKIEYENINYVRSDNQQQLIEDLKKRTGLKIHRVSVNRVDFLKDTATIKVYYYE